MSAKQKHSRVTDRTLQVGMLVIVIAVSVGFVFHRIYEERIFPGIYIGGTSVSGMTREAVRTILATFANKIDTQGISFHAVGRDVAITPTVRSLGTGSIDSSYELIRFCVDDVANQAFAIGRTGNMLRQWGERAETAIGKQAIPICFELNEEAFLQALRDNFSDLETAPQDARPHFTDEGMVISESRSGMVFDYEAALDEAIRNLRQGKTTTVTMTLEPTAPLVDEASASSLREPLEAAFAEAPLTVVVASGNKTHEWTIDGTLLGEWIVVEPGLQAVSFMVGLDDEKVSAWIDTEARPVIDQNVQEPKLEVKNGKVVVFAPGTPGRRIDAAETIEQWEKGFSEPLTIAIIEEEPKGNIGEVNTYGIKELVAEAYTDFRGSPSNRIHNIKRGAALLDGTLIPPGEEFSVLKALHPIEASNGFLPELVIKGNRTKPEVGGGLCQVSTTAFRVALEAGMPITQRRNHAYRVSYYEPPVGKDATIYDPAPDFRFKNDSENYLLLKARVEGTRIIYQLWGTKDGRSAVSTDPKVWGITAPPEPELIETEDLPVGEKKCVERAHPGSKASFTYTVTYPNGEVKEEEFFSDYRPWRAVCMIGVEKGTLSEQGEVSGEIEVAPFFGLE